MSQYRCAACGSPNVQKVDQNDGFSYKKALVGTAVFGTIGAVAGINGKRSSQYVCPDCGQTLSLPMDNIQKDLIDTVMIAPDALVSTLYPSMYSDYAYLRKERDARLQSKLANDFAVPANAGNPLGIQEEDLRTALIQIKKFDDYLSVSGVSSEIKECAYQKLRQHDWDLDIIRNGMNAAKTVTCGLPVYPQYAAGIPDLYITYRICFGAVFLDMLMTYGIIRNFNEMYDLAQSHEKYKRVLTLILQDKINQTSSDWLLTENATLEDHKRVKWTQSFIAARTGLFTIFYISGGAGEAFSFPLKLINDSLYIRNSTKPEQTLEQAAPDLMKKIADCESKLTDCQTRISELNDPTPGNEEKQYGQEMETCKAERNLCQARIAALQKKIFGKTKAQAEIAALELKIVTIDHRTDELQALLANAKEAHKAAAQSAVQAEEAQMAQVQKELDELLKQKQEYIKQIPEWICIAGPDLES